MLNEITKKSIAVAESERLYTTLFNSISHEMRTPITALLGAAEALADPRTAAAAGMLQKIAAEVGGAASRLDRIVQNLLDMTRIESGIISPRLDWCNIRDLINSTVKKMREELAAHVLNITVPADMPLVKLDFGLIEQTITNLLHNASTYTPRGSSIWITSRLDGDVCEIAVEDDGPGLPADAMKRVFEKFYRIPGTRTGGTGLGLSIAKGFVQAHNGTLVAEQRTGGGARFILRLPAKGTSPEGHRS
jgi:two-component system sensor histidine kinase KdpD